MRHTRRGAVSFYEFESLAAKGGLTAGCTGRTGGVSASPYDELNLGLHVGDDPEAVIENRRRLAEAIGADLSSFVIPRQVHDGNVEMVTAADRGRGATSLEDAVPGTDALMARDPGVVLAVMLADCVPVILFDPVTPALAIAHAGWRGTVNHVTRNAVEEMRAAFGTDPAALLAGIGPSIGPTSYEVGADVAEQAKAAFGSRAVVRPKGEDKHLFDLWTSNVLDLVDAGVPRESIEVAGIDTFDSTDRFFSDRRRRPTGRMMALAVLDP